MAIEGMRENDSSVSYCRATCPRSKHGHGPWARSLVIMRNMRERIFTILTYTEVMTPEQGERRPTARQWWYVATLARDGQATEIALDSCRGEF
jgi:hypothetical protein